MIRATVYAPTIDQSSDRISDAYNYTLSHKQDFKMLEDAMTVASLRYQLCADEVEKLCTLVEAWSLDQIAYN